MTDTKVEIGKQLIAFLPNMRRFGFSLTRSQDKADDLVQAACERALSRADGFEPGTRFDAWIFRIMRNLWIDQIRRNRTAGPQDDIDAQADLVGAEGEREVHARMELAEVARAIVDLPQEQREILVLVCGEDMAYKDVASLLDIPIGTVMSRLARARKKLAEVAGIKPRAGRSVGRNDGQGQ
ncbi:RNA polymerase sigma factor [Pararhizobium haloflavum]|uniref:RNA polymerase sigma factor n=1 Tax=Pararhizobium haloflavum TaxID=2037914 RepID=UPI000C17E30C|nr:RNA polymerase sigma factor [Pararhizobium haloflavum]